MTSVGGLDYFTTRADPEASSFLDEGIRQQMDDMLGSIGDSEKFGLTDYVHSHASSLGDIHEEEEEEEEDDGPSPKRLQASAFGETNVETDFEPAHKRPRSSASSQSSGEEVTPLSKSDSVDDPILATNSRSALTGEGSTRDTETEGEPPPSLHGNLRGGAALSLRRRSIRAWAEPNLSSVSEGSEPDSRDNSPHGVTEDVVEPGRRSSPLSAAYEEPLGKKPPDRTGQSSSEGDTVLSPSVPDTAPTGLAETDEEIMPRRWERSEDRRRSRRRSMSCTVESTRITDSRRPTTLAASTGLTSPPGSPAPALRRPPILKRPGAQTKDTSVRFEFPEQSDEATRAQSSRNVTAEPSRRRMSGVSTSETGTDQVKTGDSSVPAAPRTPGRRSMSHESNVEPTFSLFSKEGPDYSGLNSVVSGLSGVPDTGKSGIDGSNEETKPASTGVSGVSNLTPAPQERRRTERPAASSTNGGRPADNGPVFTAGQLPSERNVPRKPDRNPGLPDTSVNGEDSAIGDRFRVPVSSAPLTDSRVTGASESPPLARGQRDPPPVPDNRPERTQQSAVPQTSEAQGSVGGTDTGDNLFLNVPSTPGFQEGLGGRQSSRQPRWPGNTNAGHTGPPETSAPPVTDGSDWDSSQRFQIPGQGSRPDRPSPAYTPGRSTGNIDARRAPAAGLQPPIARPSSPASSSEAYKDYLPHDNIPDTDFLFTTDAGSTGRDGEKLTDRGGALSPSSLLPSKRDEPKPSRSRRAKRKIQSWLPSLSRILSERRRRKRKPIEDSNSDEKDDKSTDVREAGGSRQRDVTGHSDSASDMNGEEDEKGPVERLGPRRGSEYSRDTDTGEGTRGVEIDPRARRDRYETDGSQRAPESTREPPSGSSRPRASEPARRASPPRRQIPDGTTRAGQTTQDDTRYGTDRSAFASDPLADPPWTNQDGFDAEPRPFGYSNPGHRPYEEGKVDPPTSYVPSPRRDNTFVEGHLDDGQYSQDPPPSPPDSSGHGQPGPYPPRQDGPQTTDDGSRYTQSQRPGRHRYDQGDETRYDSGAPQRIPRYADSNYQGPRYRVSRYSTTPRTLSSRALAAMPSIIDDAVQGLARRRASRDRYRSYGETSPPLASQWTRSFFRDVAGAVADAGIERLRRKPNPSMRRELASAVLPIMKSRISRRLDRSPPSTYSDSQYSGGSEYDDGFRSTRGAPRSRRSRRSRMGGGSGTRSRRPGRLRKSKTTRSRGDWLTSRMRSMASFAHDVRTREKAQEGWMKSRVGDVMGAHRSRYDPVLDLPGERRVGSHVAYMSREAARSASNAGWVSGKQQEYFAQPAHSPGPPEPDDPMPREADSFADGGNLDQNLPPGGYYGRSGPPGGPRMGSRGMMG